MYKFNFAEQLLVGSVIRLHTVLQGSTFLLAKIPDLLEMFPRSGLPGEVANTFNSGFLIKVGWTVRPTLSHLPLTTIMKWQSHSIFILIICPIKAKFILLFFNYLKVYMSLKTKKSPNLKGIDHY